MGSGGALFHPPDDLKDFLSHRPLFAADREVTFTGRVADTEQVRIGEYDYRLPRLDADVVYLWPERADVQVIHHQPYPWGPVWGPGWWW